MEELELLDLFDALLDTALSEGGDEVFLSDAVSGSVPEACASAGLHGWAEASYTPFEDWDGDGVPDYADYWSHPASFVPVSDLDDGIDAEGVGFEELPSGAEPVLLDAFDAVGGPAEPDLLPGAFTLGDPVDDARYWHPQESDSSCAVAAQRGVLESILERDFSEHELAQIARDQGWYDPVSGTMPDNLGKLLEYHGIPVEQGFNTSWSDVFEAWDRGDEVIPAVDANEIWSPQLGPDGQPMEQPDEGHAVWLTGIRQDETGQWCAVVNDPGIPNGRALQVPLVDFENAWDDFGRRSVITHKSLRMPNVT